MKQNPCCQVTHMILGFTVLIDAPNACGMKSSLQTETSQPSHSTANAREKISISGYASIVALLSRCLLMLQRKRHLFLINMT